MRTLFAAALVFLALPAHAAPPAVHEILLTGSRTLVTLDYFAWDAAHGRLWVPAGNDASVAVLDAASGTLTSITGFATATFDLRGRRGKLGPSSVSVGDGVVYVGNRADSSICVVDAATLRRGSCVQVAKPSQGWAGAPDGIVYVAATRELWITRGAPPLGIASIDKAITILDASHPRDLRIAARVPLGASAEGYAVDDGRGRFYTNLEETGETVAIDVRRRAVAGRWKSGCGEARGLALDRKRGILFVACPARVVALDAAHGGAVLGSLGTGEGLDNIDYSESDGLLYAAASKTGSLTIARVGNRGEMSAIATVPTAAGARGVVAGGPRHAYVADPYGGRILDVVPGDS